MAGLNGVKITLTQAQLSSIRTELDTDPAGKGYSSATNGGKVRLMNEHPLIANPNPQGQINGPAVKGGDVLKAGGLSLADVSAIQADADGVKIWAMLMGLAEIDLNSALAGECIGVLQAKGLLTQAQVDAISALGQIPNPAWLAQVPDSSRSDIVLGAGYTVEGADITAALAL